MTRVAVQPPDFHCSLSLYINFASFIIKSTIILTGVQTSYNGDSVDEEATTQAARHVVSDVTDTRTTNRLHAAAANNALIERNHKKHASSMFRPK